MINIHYFGLYKNQLQIIMLYLLLNCENEIFQLRFLTVKFVVCINTYRMNKKSSKKRKNSKGGTVYLQREIIH